MEVQLPREVEIEKGEVTSTEIPPAELSQITVSIYEALDQSGDRNNEGEELVGVGEDTGNSLDKERFTKQ